MALNKAYSALWPNIVWKGEAPTDADEHLGEEGKFEKYFSPEPDAID